MQYVISKSDRNGGNCSLSRRLPFAVRKNHSFRNKAATPVARFLRTATAARRFLRKDIIEKVGFRSQEAK